MKILIDMNLTPLWVDFFITKEIESIHWSSVGPHNSPDELIFQWAKENDHIVFTHDLDFGAILAATNADAPSVIQVRTQDIMPGSIGEKVVEVLLEHKSTVEKGALLTIDDLKARIRILPFR